MQEERQALEIEGLAFATTGEGLLLPDDVRRHVSSLNARIASLESENGELRGRLDHLTSLQRLAEATIVKADELAAEIEATARARADELMATCERELSERRQRFEAEQAAELAAARQRVEQLQVALEGSVQTLARAMQAVGAPALEMPPARVPVPPPDPSPAQRPYAAPPPPPDVGAGSPWGAGEGFGLGVTEAPPGEPPAAAPPEEASDGKRAGDGAPIPYVGLDTPFGAPASSTGVPEPGPAHGPAAASAAPEAREAEPTGGGNGREPAWPPAGAVEGKAAMPSEPRDEAAVPERAATVPADPGPPAAAVARRGGDTIEIDMRPVRSFADLARVTKLLGGIAPGAQPVDLNLPQHRALFSVRGRDREALASQLADALPEAKVLQRENGIDVLLGGEQA